MKYRSVFDIIGPVMIGPSSSHTAGAARIGRLARLLFGEAPTEVQIHLYGSFAKTYRGHGTDVALAGGLLDFDTFDERLPESIQLAEDQGIQLRWFEEHAVTDHPNTVRLRLKKGEREMEIVGISIGGGKVEITELNGFDLRLSGHHPAIFIVHQDRYGVIAEVSNQLAEREMNIGHMEVSRRDKGEEALMVIEVDQPVDAAVLTDLEKLDHVIQVAKIQD
ncbi:L-serine ammonia-lyase [Salsuginibacillus halophilus]|uniref:L-serine deaminase n=1 Tax=Salsuginibacillus halophilus TaxID=517424 RepID=A0A2P8HY27_9BACI|nr:L-serine ammonia-lyase, iron-sulfur-dependent subunit beta [Salsuginibacillus halophilus]PSL51151.1 L-serine ammonia-lyase [Salsuginibacillus halophilus]